MGYPREKQREYMREWRKKNRDKANRIQQKWRNANREHVRQKTREQMKRWRPANRDKIADGRLKRIYGITRAERDALLEAQGHKCAICATAFGAGRRRHVDHDHKSGAVRGILCGQCNQALGLMGDDPSRLKSAASYVAKALDRATYVQGTIGARQKLLAGTS